MGLVWVPLTILNDLELYKPEDIPDGFFSNFPNIEDLKIDDPYCQELEYQVFHLKRWCVLNEGCELLFGGELHIDASGLTRFEYWGYSPKLVCNLTSKLCLIM